MSLPSKYHNRKTVYKDRTFDSKREADYAARLDILKRAKDPKERVEKIEYQIRIPIIINGVKICSYIADFKVTYGDGRTETQDVKGFKTPVYKLKKKMVKAVYDIDIVEI